MADRPISRKKNVTGSGSVHRRPMGTSGGSGGNRGVNGGGGGGLGKLLIFALIILLGGGGGLGAFLGGGGSGGSSGGSTGGNTAGNTISTLASTLLGGGYTSMSQSGNSTWSMKSNTGVLDESVASSSREKYTKINGNGADTMTIMVYMCGTDLESRAAMASKDIQEMLNATVSGNINLLVYTGGCAGWKNSVVSNRTNQIYQIKNGKMALLKDNIGDLPMTDPNTLSSFIKWGGQNFPANRYALIFWDHGGGSVTGYGYDEKHKNAGSMDLAEINKALTDGGLKYDFIGFDACLMATVETGLMLDSHSDYMIASEETEPGIGWYYTNWLTNLSGNSSQSTLEIGKTIVDDFVAQCGQQCPGQKTTLSLIDLAELSATVPEDLKGFANSTTSLIEKKEYKVVSDARASTREFASSSRIDQIDLIDFAVKLDNSEGKELAQSLLGAVKYNKTSSNMTNAYGLSIYFPYRQTSKVDNMVSTYDEIGMDDSYSECIQKFASMEYYGQQATNNNQFPSSIFSSSGSSSGIDLTSPEAIGQILGMLSSASGNKFLENGVDREIAAEYIAENNLDLSNLQWTKNDAGDTVIALDENQWENVQDIELSTLVKDGDGYIDLGLDNTFEWDEEGNLIANTDRSWLAIDGQIVAYYHIDTTGTSDNYTITGRVPVMLNGQRADLILVFDSAHEDGYVAGAVFGYDENTEVIAKNLTELQPGDTIDFICKYYAKAGDDVSIEEEYYLGEQMTIDKDMSEMQITNLVIEDSELLISYVFTDIYGNEYYTDALKQ